MRIVETEAYKGPEDQACHAANYRKTARTLPFYKEGGHWYVFTIYMKHNICLNVVVNDKNCPEAVQIRAAEVIEGLEEVKENRKGKLKKVNDKKIFDQCNGPGKLGQAFGVDPSYSGKDFIEDEEFYLEKEEGFVVHEEDVMVSPRINIDNAGAEWVKKMWRFFLRGNKWVSKK